MAKKSFVAEIQDILHPFVADGVSRKRDGTIVARKGFYYRQGKDARDFVDKVNDALRAAGIQYTIKDYGEQWKPFKGGSTLAKSSHWWVEICPVDSTR